MDFSNPAKQSSVKQLTLHLSTLDGESKSVTVSEFAAVEDLLQFYPKGTQGKFILGNIVLLPAMSLNYFSVSDGDTLYFIPQQKEKKILKEDCEDNAEKCRLERRAARAKLYDVGCIMNDFRSMRQLSGTKDEAEYFYMDYDLKLDYRKPKKPSEDPLPTSPLFELWNMEIM